MNTKFFILLLGLITLFTTTQAQTDLQSCGFDEETESSGSSLGQNCNCNFTNFRSNHNDDMVPQGIERTLKVKTNLIFVQEDNGGGNFSLSNSEDVEYWDRVFDTLNYRLEHLIQESCDCATNPTHYSNIHIQFEPRYIELKNSYYWNHRHDADSNTLNSSNKPFLRQIHNIVSQMPGYVDGFDVIFTMDSIMWNRWEVIERSKPIWELGYDCVNFPVYTLDSSCVVYSGFPRCDSLERPAMWHYPDRYLILQNAIDFVYPYGMDYVEMDIPATAGLMLHEYGHYFSLIHTDTSCHKNIMIPSGGAKRSSYTGCQVRAMYETLMTKNLRKYVVCEDRLDFDLTVDSDENWTVNTRVFGDIVIEDGGSLTIACQVSMDPNAGIIVKRGGKLIVDGGLITSDCKDKWDGIIVEGDVPGEQANSGKVILKNSAIIEFAKTAVSMNPTHLPWNDGEQQKYYMGIIEATNSTFRFCDRAVAFMKYDSLGIKDSSFFNEVKFENLKYGVTVWADDGVKFDSCTFVNIDSSGIYAIDAELLVGEKNTFDTIPIGIDILTASLRPYSSKIGREGGVPNEFRTAIGINVQSTPVMEPLTIVNNYFEGQNNTDKGIHLNGNSMFLFQFNSFTDDRKAIELYESGEEFNQILNNEIDDSWVGSHSIKNNLGLHYMDNCFSSSSFMDIAATVNGIFPYQGSSSIAAGNCFTKNHITEIYNSSSDPITYFVKSGTSQVSCNYPSYLYNVTLNPNSADQDPSSCGTSMDSITGPIDQCSINRSHTISQLKSDRSSLISAKSGATVGSYNYKMYE